ncbi:MAG: hypothetical protein AAGA85_17820 [Bacteroidota bacterium]
MRRVLIIISGLLLLSGCQTEMCREVPALAKVKEIKINRLERELFQSQDAAEVVAFLEGHPGVATNFLHSNEYPSGDVLGRQIFGLINDPFLDTLYREAVETFDANEGQFQEDLSEMFSRLEAYFPNTQVPKVVTMVTGLYNDLFIGQEEIIVGLDFFIGPAASYHPQDVPAYIQKRYTQRHMAAIITKFVANAHTRTGRESTLLSEMIDFGKVNYLVSRLLPCTPDSIILGYTPNEMIAIQENREVIWANFIENELLYDTSEFMKQKFLGERPNIFEISKNCPGRVGAWVGWEIVEDYMRNEQVTMQQLLAETDHHMIFSKSNYRAIND